MGHVLRLVLDPFDDFAEAVEGIELAREARARGDEGREAVVEGGFLGGERGDVLLNVGAGGERQEVNQRRSGCFRFGWDEGEVCCRHRSLSLLQLAG